MIDCSLLENYLKEKSRMTDYCKVSCAGCLFSRANNGSDVDCRHFECIYPDKAIAFVQEWSDNHPQKTYIEDFLEKHPKAVSPECIIDHICRKFVYGYEGATCTETKNCEECWKMVMEDD